LQRHTRIQLQICFRGIVWTSGARQRGAEQKGTAPCKETLHN